MARALMLTGDAAEELDAMYPLYRIREAGWEVDVAAPSRRDVQLVIHDFDAGSDAYTEKHGRRLPVDLAFAEVDVERYDALVIPGGRAPEYIRLDPDVRRITEHFFARDLPVGTICHGPQVPAVYGLLRGRTTAAFPPLQATWRTPAPRSSTRPDVVDGNMVSCRGWPDMPEWSRAFMAVLSGPRPGLARWTPRSAHAWPPSSASATSLADPELTAGYERDVTGRFGGRAAGVVRPASADEVAAVLAACADGRRRRRAAGRQHRAGRRSGAARRRGRALARPPGRDRPARRDRRPRSRSAPA